MQLMVEFDLGF